MLLLMILTLSFMLPSSNVSLCLKLGSIRYRCRKVFMKNPPSLPPFLSPFLSPSFSLSPFMQNPYIYAKRKRKKLNLFQKTYYSEIPINTWLCLETKFLIVKLRHKMKCIVASWKHARNPSLCLDASFPPSCQKTFVSEKKFSWTFLELLLLN